PVDGSEAGGRGLHPQGGALRLDRARNRGAGTGVVEGRQAAGDPLRLVGRESDGGEPGLPTLRRGERAVDGARTDPPGRTRPRTPAAGNYWVGDRQAHGLQPVGLSDSPCHLSGPWYNPSLV